MPNDFGNGVPFTGNNGIGNEFVNALLNNENFVKNLEKRLGPLAKADTIQQATNLLWYDLRPIVQMLYPYRELIPRISRLPRVQADVGNAAAKFRGTPAGMVKSAARRLAVRPYAG